MDQIEVLGGQHQKLEEFYYVLKLQARETFQQPVGIRFIGRTVGEFKEELYQMDPYIRQMPNLHIADLELIHNKKIL